MFGDLVVAVGVGVGVAEQFFVVLLDPLLVLLGDFGPFLFEFFGHDVFVNTMTDFVEHGEFSAVVPRGCHLDQLFVGVAQVDESDGVRVTFQVNAVLEFEFVAFEQGAVSFGELFQARLGFVVGFALVKFAETFHTTIYQKRVAFFSHQTYNAFVVSITGKPPEQG